MPQAFIKGNKNAIQIGKIICVGRNYAEHAREMKAEVPTFPVLFLKPPSAVIGNDKIVVIPSISKELHHEVEMTILIGTGGSKIKKERAFDHIAAVGIGLDMTLRDIQQEAKTKGLPWTLAKGFDTSAPISEFIPIGEIRDIHALELTLSVNDQVRQKGNTRDFLFRTDTLIELISQYFTLETGDIIFTGTPPGVQQTVDGDRLFAELKDSVGIPLASLSVTIRSENNE